MKADSNMEMTLLLRSLSHAEEILRSRGISMPKHLVTIGDNTAKELRNQWSYKVHALLVSQRVFRSATVGHHDVGHTHGLCDQRFSIIASALKNENSLECPEDGQARVGLDGVWVVEGSRSLGSQVNGLWRRGEGGVGSRKRMACSLVKWTVTVSEASSLDMDWAGVG